MKDKLIELYKQYKLAIIIGLSVFIVGLIGIIIFFIFINNSSIKEYKNDNYIVKYDKSWRIKTKKDKIVVLQHNKGSKLSIELIDIQDDYKYSSVDELLDELLYNIEEQNMGFNLLYKEHDSITKNELDGYRLLYENDNSQAMVSVARKGDKLVIFTFEAKNTYFDILLDSVQNIIYDFDTVDKKYDLTQELNIKTEKINYSSEDIVESLLKDTSKWDIAASNYHVEYSIPSNFKIKYFDSQIGSFNFDGLRVGNSISLTVNLYNKNLYEYMDKDRVLNFYSDFKAYKESTDEYSDFRETLDSLDGDNIGYIYNCSYYYNNIFAFDEDDKKVFIDNYVLIYELDKNHIVLFTISSNKVHIPKSLIDMIKITKIENYSSYISSSLEDGLLKSSLKRYLTDDDIVEEVKINLPEKYKEVDKKTNVYSTRNFGLNYNNKLDTYDYNVEYTLTNYYATLDKQIDLINDVYLSKGSKLQYSGEREINGKKYLIYDGRYTNYAGILLSSKNMIEYNVNVKALFYELPRGGFLVIRINGTNRQISDEILNDVTNLEFVNS